jgi:uncharacterized protein (DUF1800 family)
LRSGLDLINSLADLPRAEAIEQIVTAPPQNVKAAESDKSDNTVTWWYNQIKAPGSGLHERMTFFWHNHLPTNRWGSGPQQLIGRQLTVLRTHALGNFRDLLQAMMVDGAMLMYLDANSSTVKRPNENLARESMELFTFGVGNYTEDDVRQAALAMTGWRVDKDSRTVSFDASQAYPDPVTFLGETKQWDMASIVDRLCDDPATAVRISGLIWAHFTGETLTGAAATELGAWWQEQQLAILPLIRRALESEVFWATEFARPRSGLEFYAAILPVAQLDTTKLWQARALGQALYEPPNVGGWPWGDRWLSPDSLLRRTNQVFNINFEQIDGAHDATLDQILDQLGLFVVSEETLGVFNDNLSHPDLLGKHSAELLWRLAMSCPEFQML